ncbi:MAG: peptidoglycan-binding protein [Lachnospiraceae bacterium]
MFDESNDAKRCFPLLCTGSRGERVRALQNRLIDLRFLHEMADGAFGSSTKAAVTKFQAEAKGWGIFQREPDGLADPDTVRLLNVDLSSLWLAGPGVLRLHPARYAERELSFFEELHTDGRPQRRSGCSESASRERRYPASTTKILTLMVALESGGLEDIVTIPQEAADVPADSSLVPVTPGEQMRKLDLLYGLMIRSGNDAANAIAVLEAGSVEAFVERMNEKAAQIGMGDSHFANPHGYHDEGHHTTAYDLALLAGPE